MTKKHYIRVAAAFASSVQQLPHNADRAAHFYALREIADRLCVVFATDNPKFQRETFLRACELTGDRS